MARAHVRAGRAWRAASQPGHAQSEHSGPAHGSPSATEPRQGLHRGSPLITVHQHDKMGNSGAD
jgi:hypothetical protein